MPLGEKSIATSKKQFLDMINSIHESNKVSKSADSLFEGIGKGEEACTWSKQAHSIIFGTVFIEVLQVSIVSLF